MYECLQGVTPFAPADGADPSYNGTYRRVKAFAKLVRAASTTDKEVQPAHRAWCRTAAAPTSAPTPSPRWSQLAATSPPQPGAAPGTMGG